METLNEAPDSFPGRRREISAHCATQLSDVVQRAMTMTHATGAAIAVVDGRQMITAASKGESVPPVGTRAPISGFTGLAIQKKETLICDDTQADARVDAAVCKALGIQSMAVTPIRVDGAVEGVVAVFGASSRAFSRTHVAMVRTLADVAATLLERELDKPQFATAADIRPAPIQPEPSPTSVSAEPQKPAPNVAEALKDITDEDVAAVLAQLDSTSSKAPVPREPVKVVLPASAAKSEPKPAAISKATLVTPAALLRAAAKEATEAPKSSEALPPAVDPKPLPRVPLTADVRPPMKETPLFESLPSEAPRGAGAYRRMLLPLAGIAAVVVAVAGFELYRSPSVKATTAPPAASAPAPEPPAPEPVKTEPAPVPVVPAATAPVTKAPVVTPAPPAAEPRPKPASNNSKPVAESVPARPVMVVPSSPAESRPRAEAQVEAPALTFTPTGGSALLPAPKPGMPAAPRPSVYVPGRLLQKTQPAYPSMALARHLEGTVVLQVNISKDGKVVQAKSVKGNPLLGQAATEAVKNWRYAPATQDGTPVDSQTEVSVVFKLPGGM